METLQIYRNTSVEWKPAAVVALATSPDGTQVAAAREDCSLEIWLVSPGSVGWHCQMTIHGSHASRVTSLAWCRPNSKDAESGRGRLLSSSIDGSVSEWDLFSLKQKIILDSVGVSIWQMAVEPAMELHSLKQDSQTSVNGYVNDTTHSGSESCQSDDDDELPVSHYERDGQRVAIACDDGCIRIYGISSSDEFSYKRPFPRVSGRLLSIAWSLDAKFLFSGTSDGLIRCWNAMDAHETYRITVGLGCLGSRSELCVWSLLFLRCGTLVSADSGGSVQFWDSRHGTLLQAYSYHKGDVNALAADPGHKRVFSAGSDGQVILYKHSKTTVSFDEYEHVDEPAIDWAYVGRVRAHTHDVRALAVAVPISSEGILPNGKRTRRRKEKPISFTYHKWAHLGVPMLLSAGEDAKIFTYPVRDFTQFSPHDVCPAPQHLPVHLANNVGLNGCPLLLIQKPGYLDVLSVHTSGSTPTNMCMGCNANTRLLAQIKSRGSRKIICSAISGSGLFFAYSDHVKPSLFELRRERVQDSSYTGSKRKLPQEIPSAHSMVFSADSSILILAGYDKKIYVVHVEKLELLYTFVPGRREVNKYSLPNEPPITKMFTSVDGQWLAAINSFGDVYIFNLEIYRQHWFISRLDGACVTAGGFPPGNSNILVITTSSNQMYVFDLEAKELGEWSRRHTYVLPRRFLEFPGEVIGLSFPPSSSTSVIVYSARAMCLIDFGMPVEDDNGPANGSSPSLEKLLVASRNMKTKKRKDLEQEIMIRTRNFDFCAFKDPALFVGHLSDKSLFVLQKPWLEVVRTFEEPVHRHIYGT